MEYIVFWVTYNRDNPVWKEIKNYQLCTTLEKAKKFKKNVESQNCFIQASIAKII